MLCTAIEDFVERASTPSPPLNDRTVFVGGTVRSGSTLLAGLLATRFDGFNAGELHLLWRSFGTARLCTCGQPLAACAFWSRVRSRVIAELGDRDFGAIERREPRLRTVAVLGSGAHLDPELVRLRRATEAAIREESGLAVIIDSSKSPGTALVTAAAGPVELLQLVRDPRAVVYSMARPKADPSLGGELMPAMGTVEATIYWRLTDQAFSRMRRHMEIPIVRYRDLVVSPFARAGSLTHGIAGEHAIAGNPWRFEPGQPIEADERWRTEMSRATLRVVDGLTVLSRRKLGY